jgi:ligand-binding sensor domain-containing protein/putative methionine-R-sulfoxide reductase with GAF domain
LSCISGKLYIPAFSNLCCLIFLLLPLLGNAQQKEFAFNQLSVKDGLSHGIVNSMAQDKDGFMWIGTYNGLNRYDGTKFLVYKSKRNDDHALIHNSIHQISIDKENNVWCATEAGVSCFRRKTDQFENYRLLDDSSHKDIKAGAGSILCDRQGIVWVGTPAGLFEYIPTKNTFRQYRYHYNDSTSLSSSIIPKHSIAEDPQQKGIWVGTNIGLNYFDSEKKIAYNYRNNPQRISAFLKYAVYPVSFDRKNNLVYGETVTNSICFYNSKTNTVSRSTKINSENKFKATTEIATLFFDSGNNLWVTSWNYIISYIDAATGKIYEIAHDESNPKSINSNFSWDIFEDSEGTIYIGGLNGISYFNPKSQKYLVYQPDKIFPAIKNHNRVYNFFEDSRGLLWFGTIGAGLYSYNFNTEEYHNYNYEKNSGKRTDPANSIYAIAEIKNELWCGTQTGVKIFNREKMSFRNFNGIPSKIFPDTNIVVMMACESDSVIWMSNYSVGLFRYNVNNGSYKFWNSYEGSKDTIAIKYISSLSSDKKNNIYVGTYSEGLLKYSLAADNFIHYPADDYDSTKFTRSLISKVVEDSKGNLWMTLKGDGLFSLNPVTGKVKRYTENDGLSFDHSMAVEIDHFGKIWAIGYNLVSILDPLTDKFENFMIDFAAADYQYSNKLLTLTDGKIVGPLLGAFVVIDPEKQLKKIATPRVLISRFSVFEKALANSALKSSINLSHAENFFSIDYSVFTGTEKEKIKYAYLLEGYDNNWVYAGERKTASYTNVPGGDYTFKVKAYTEGNFASAVPTDIKIHISTIFYKTWWFRILVILAFVALLYRYLRFRDNEKEKDEAEKSISYFADSVYGQNSVDEILWDLARNVITRLGFVDCVIYLLDAETNMLVQKAALGSKNPEGKIIANKMDIAVGSGIVGTVAKTGKAIIIHDTSKDARYIPDDDIRFSEIAVPILYEDKVIGVIDSEHPQKHFFSADHLRILETIASICSVKIVKAQAKIELEQKEWELLEYDKKVAELRLTALRAQMNPHFIFNCLNAIDNFILKNNPEQASLFLNKFARLIRSILSESDKSEIPVESEMEMLKNYIELENLRFDEKFTCSIDIDPSINGCGLELPPMLIQPFVENAIIHGLSNKTGSKKLSVQLRLVNSNIECTIEDNGVGRLEAARIRNSKSVSHESKGMKITASRFELLHQKMSDDGNILVTDLFDNENNPCGTRVKINIPVETD